jgi:hypothetical protein
MGCGSFDGLGGRPSLGEALVRTFTSEATNDGNGCHSGLSDDCNSVAIAGSTVYLQIAKSVPAYVFYFSTDGRSWQVLRVFSLEGSKARVGFESHSLRQLIETKQVKVISKIHQAPLAAFVWSLE